MQGQETALHYIRTNDGAEVDFALSQKGQLTKLVECILSDPKPHRALLRFAREQPQAQAVQVVRHLPHWLTDSLKKLEHHESANPLDSNPV